jgi:pyrroline-5-carboxylate reductase
MAGKKLGIIGAGNMGGAIAQGVVRAGLYAPEDIVVYDVLKEKAGNLKRTLGTCVAGSTTEVASVVSTAILAVKPQSMEKCLTEVGKRIDSSHLVISIAAGISTQYIERRLNPECRVVSVMPNTPALVGAGASAICSGEHASAGDLKEAERIFGVMGKVYRLDESYIDAITAVSGSGPAYLFLFAESLEKAAKKVGLTADQAADIVAQTLFGSAKLLVESDKSAAVLRTMVTSPGGTTEAAVAIMDKRDFEGIVVEAVEGALKRAKELGGE